MTGAGILSGDVVVLEFREPRNGEVVAALIDGERQHFGVIQDLEFLGDLLQALRRRHGRASRRR